MKLEHTHIKQHHKAEASPYFLNKNTVKIDYVFRVVLNIMFLFLSVTFFSQDIFIKGGAVLVDNTNKQTKHDSSTNITVYGGAKIVQVQSQSTTNTKKEDRVVVKKKKPVLKKKIYVKIKSRIKKDIYFNSKENKVFSFVKENKLKTVVENTRDNIVKKGVLSRRFLFEILQLQLPQIECVFSFIRYQFLKTYSTRPPPYYTI